MTSLNIRTNIDTTRLNDYTNAFLLSWAKSPNAGILTLRLIRHIWIGPKIEKPLIKRKQRVGGPIFVDDESFVEPKERIRGDQISRGNSTVWSPKI